MQVLVLHLAFVLFCVNWCLLAKKVSEKHVVFVLCCVNLCLLAKKVSAKHVVFVLWCEFVSVGNCEPCGVCIVLWEFMSVGNESVCESESACGTCVWCCVVGALF